jgi:uncharacterized Fe-S radical SAM superfamily protein PflX
MSEGHPKPELLISRLVRVHWEPSHLESVEKEFQARYVERPSVKVKEVLRDDSEWCEFCVSACGIERAPGEKMI